MEILLVLALPLAGGVILALVGHRRYAAEVNSLFSFLTLAAAIRLAVLVVDRGSFVAVDELFFVDPFNVFLVALTAFVSFTTTLFSRPYMRNEAAKGKLSPNMMRLYHSMFQVFGFTMLLALLTNNIGILWVAMEAATLATVLLVSLYRTPASLEAAWKYFILCGVGIAQALFGTILVYFGRARARQWRQRAPVDAPLRRKRPVGADRARPRLCLFAGRLRHQGRSRAVAQLAAGCAR